MKENVNKTGTQAICIVTFCGAVINANKMILLSHAECEDKNVNPH